MGMFDYLIFEQEVEGLPKPSSKTWPQTKSLEKTMSKYIVRDNKLYRRFETWRETDEIAYKIGDFEIPKRELVSYYDGQYNYHGDIIFNSIGEGDGASWERYAARFAEGNLQWVIPFEEYDKIYTSP